MKYKQIKKIHQGDYLTRYNIEYETKSGKNKSYEMISRDSGIESFDALRENKIDAVVIIVHDETGEKLLLNREYRMATGRRIYNFPAGLIDEGESPEKAAARELYEETGLRLVSINETWTASYSAVGFSNEKNIVIVGTAKGAIGSSDSEMEEIEAGWYTKAEVRDLLSREYFAARTQAYCMLWSRYIENNDHR